MISFLTCNAKATLNLSLEVTYQDKDKIHTHVYYIDSDKIYKLTVADNMAGLVTYNCRITGYSSFVDCNTLKCINQNTKPIVIDIIKIDYSEDNKSLCKSINVNDIRYIEELSTSGFDEITNREVPTFK